MYTKIVLDSWDHVEFRVIGPESAEDALRVIGESFLKDESICRCIGLDRSIGAIREIEHIFLTVIEQNVSVGAFDRETGLCMAVALNDLQCLGMERLNPAFLESRSKSCQHAPARTYLDYMTITDSIYDMHSYYDVDCIMEVMFVATLRRHRNLGLAKRLFELSVDMAKGMPAAKAVSVYCTSPAIKGLAKRNGFESLAEFSFAQLIEPEKALDDSLLANILTVVGLKIANEGA